MSAELEAAITSRAATILTQLKQDNRALYRRAMSILSKLKAISHAPSAPLVQPLSGSKASTKPPPNMGITLYEIYLRRIAEAGDNLDRLARLVREVEIDYDRELGTTPKPKGKDGTESDEEAQKRVCVMYVGHPAKDVANIEGHRSLDEWVRKARRAHRKDPETGRDLPAFRGWDDERRVKEIHTLRVQGCLQTQAAAEFGVSERTLKKYWAKAEPAF